ncbi:DUF2239 family protein [Halovulum sp. GXIMD14794]
MTHDPTLPATAFAGMTRIASGPLAEVAETVALSRPEALLVFDDRTGRVLDLDLRGTPEEVRARLAPPEVPQPRRTRGRPKLGVVAREVTLLPRHWDWLAAQPGGASASLRRLVEQARRSDDGRTDARRAQAAAYGFMQAIAGDLPEFEEASRALFAGDLGGLAERMHSWPEDIRAHALKLAQSG